MPTYAKVTKKKVWDDHGNKVWGWEVQLRDIYDGGPISNKDVKTFVDNVDEVNAWIKGCGYQVVPSWLEIERVIGMNRYNAQGVYRLKPSKRPKPKQLNEQEIEQIVQKRTEYGERNKRNPEHIRFLESWDWLTNQEREAYWRKVLGNDGDDGSSSASILL